MKEKSKRTAKSFCKLCSPCKNVWGAGNNAAAHPLLSQAYALNSASLERGEKAVMSKSHSYCTETVVE